MRISRQPSAIQIVINKKEKPPKVVEYFNYLCIVIIYNVRRTREIKSRISAAEAAFNSKKTFFTSLLD